MDEHTISPAGDPFTSAPRHNDDVARDDHHDQPHGCCRGVVYLTFEEDGHEWTEPVPCRRCSAR